MKNKYRTIYCGEVTTKNIGEEIKVAGWLEQKRNLGSLVFMTLRDETGVIQLISEDIDSFKDITRESTMTVTGVVRHRAEGMTNPNMKTGEVEVLVSSFEVLGEAKSVLPFEINRSTEAFEDTRLKYRYLDLRNPKVHDRILFRTEVLDYMRKIMKEMNFTEIQTPILTASSPEGARDFIVPSRKYKGKFYALPQAPQIFKQLLMCSGFNRYFQIAPCFRDEDPRSDRLYGDFYQLDLEMSFATDEDVYAVGERIFYDIFTHFSDKEVSERPFRRIPFKEAMLKYGSDKPDLRNPLYIIDLSEFFSRCTFKPFIGRTVRAIKVSGHMSKGFHEKMLDYAMKIGMKGLGYLEVQEDLSYKGPIDKFIPEELKKELISLAKLEKNDTIFFIADNEKRATELAGQIRTELGKRLDLIDEDVFKFCWIIDFPMFELDDHEKLAFSHNPFSMPQGGLDALEHQNPLDTLAYQYDIVCNGIELSSGAVRNHDIEIMLKAFSMAGYTEEEVKTKFGALYTAFQFGAPPHAGIAPGIDRMLMLLTNSETIREVIAFPLNSKAEDLMMGAPGNVKREQLRDVHIEILRKG
mgnify:CR=1 FL=1